MHSQHRLCVCDAYPKYVLIKEEDEARLSPLQYGHINVLGHYSFVLNEKVMQGELRPFNQLADNIEDP